MLPVGSVKKVEVTPPTPRPESPAGCFSCGDLTHETEQCPVLDESFPFLPLGWRADRIHDEFILRPGPREASLPAGGKRRLIRGGGLVTRISNDNEPQLPVVGEDVPRPAARDQVGAVRPLEMVDQGVMVVGDGFRLPCSDLDDSDDDVLSVGPIRPLLTAAPLGGARRDDDCRLQVDSLNDELSVEAWTAENRHETCCARLDDFDWVVPPYDLDRILPRPKLTRSSQTLREMSVMSRMSFRSV